MLALLFHDSIFFNSWIYTTSVQEFIQEEEEEEGSNGEAGGGDDLSLSDFHLQVLRRMEIELTVKDSEEKKGIEKKWLKKKTYQY